MTNLFCKAKPVTWPEDLVFIEVNGRLIQPTTILQDGLYGIQVECGDLQGL